MNSFLKENFFKLLIGSSILILSIGVLIYIVTATQTPPSANDKIIGEPIKIGGLEVAEYDFSEYMYRDDAVRACKALGSSWRLPTKNELNLLYKNKNKISGFAPERYWNRNMTQEFFEHFQDFSNVKQDSCYRNGHLCNVRAVRTF